MWARASIIRAKKKKKKLLHRSGVSCVFIQEHGYSPTLFLWIFWFCMPCEVMCILSKLNEIVQQCELCTWGTHVFVSIFWFEIQTTSYSTAGIIYVALQRGRGVCGLDIKRTMKISLNAVEFMSPRNILGLVHHGGEVYTAIIHHAQRMHVRSLLIQNNFLMMKQCLLACSEWTKKFHEIGFHREFPREKYFWIPP